MKIGWILFPLALCSYGYVTSNKQIPTFKTTPYTVSDSLKTAAFQVLENNCNACHLDKKPSFVFTPDNMNLLAASINVQVFVKGKMPKGRKNKLSSVDRETLKIWVNQVLDI